MSKSDIEDFASEAEEYEVEAIRKHRKQGGITEFLVKWKNYDDSENTWEPEENLETASEIVAQYWAEQEKKKPKTSRKRSKTPQTDNTAGKNKKIKEKHRSPSPIFSDLSSLSFDSPKNTVEKDDSSEEFVLSKTFKKNQDENGYKYGDQKEDYKEHTIDDDYDEEDGTLESNNRPKRTLKIIMKNTSEEDELRNLDEEEEDDTYDEAETKHEKEEEEDDDDDDDNDREANDGKFGFTDATPHSISISMDIEGNGKPKKYQVIVDRDQVDSSLSWEKDVEKIINVYQDQEEHRYQGVVKWSNGTYSLHPNEELRKKCPEQLIDFYENHLYFRSS